jgi:hypothetical protein
MKLVKVLLWNLTLYVSLLSEKYKTGKMNYVKAFFWIAFNFFKENFEYSSHIYILKTTKIILNAFKRFLINRISNWF